MGIRALSCTGLVLSALLVGACTGVEKTENPLTPTIAGPIPGVNIAPPSPLDPKDGRQIEFSSQPITLSMQNAQTNGVRPLTYLVEIATDTAFNNRVFARDGVAPGQDGKTTVRLETPLATGRTYYWRAKAADGANESPTSSFVHFNIFTQIIIDKPTPREPINNVMLESATPRFAIGNAPRSGPVGAISYIVEVAASDTFLDRYAVWTIPEQPGQTAFNAPSALPSGKQLYWRASAFDGGNQGRWSDTQTFRTPAPPAPKPQPTPSPSPGPNGPKKGHIPAGPPTDERAQQVVFGTYDEFPGLSAVFPSDAQAEDAAEQLLLRTIWHLQLAGFQAARQRNPSGLISKDKLTINIGGWRCFDIYSLGYAGRATTVQFFEISGTNPVPDPGIPD